MTELHVRVALLPLQAVGTPDNGAHGCCGVAASDVRGYLGLFLVLCHQAELPYPASAFPMPVGCSVQKGDLLVS